MPKKDFLEQLEREMTDIKDKYSFQTDKGNETNMGKLYVYYDKLKQYVSDSKEMETSGIPANLQSSFGKMNKLKDKLVEEKIDEEEFSYSYRRVFNDIMSIVDDMGKASGDECRPVTEQRIKNSLADVKDIYDLRPTEKGNMTNIQKIYRIYEDLGRTLSERHDDDFEINMYSYFKLLDTLDEYTDEVANRKLENEEFSYDDYELFPLFTKVSEKLGDRAPRELSVIEQTETNSNEPIFFNDDYSILNVCDRLGDFESIYNFNTNNDLLGKHYSNAQIHAMGSTLSSHFAKNANMNRCGAWGFLYMAFMSKGYTPEDIYSNKVSEEDYEEMYQNIMKLREKTGEKATPDKMHDNWDENINFEALGGNSEMADEKDATDWADEVFMDGMQKAFTKFDEGAKYSTRHFSRAMFNPATQLLGEMIRHCSTNYFENDEKFVSRIEDKLKKSGIEYKGHPFDIQRAYSMDQTLINSFSADNFKFLRGFLGTPQTHQLDQVVPLEYLKLMTVMNSKFTTSPSFFTLMQFGCEDLENGEEFVNWFLAHGNEPAFPAFFEKMNEHSPFSKTHINPETGKIAVEGDMKQVQKDYEKFVKDFKKEIESDYQIAVFEKSLSKAIEKDKKGIYINDKDFLNLPSLNLERESLIEDCSKLSKEKILNIRSTVEKLKEAPELKTEENYRLLGKMRVELEKFNKKKSDINEISEFLKKDPVEFKEGSKAYEDVQEFDEMIDSVLKKTELKDSKDIDVSSYNPVDKKAEALGKLNRINDINEDSDYKKAIGKQKLPETVNVIKNMYSKALEQLKGTCEMENGKPVGRSDYFMDMFNSIEAVANYNGDGSYSDGGFSALLEKATMDVSKYKEKRDSFIMWTSKGSERLKVAKDMLDVCETAQEEYNKLCISSKSAHEKYTNALKVKTEDLADFMSRNKVDKSVSKTKIKSRDKAMADINEKAIK